MRGYKMETMCNRLELPIDEAMELCDWLDEFHHCRDCDHLYPQTLKGKCPECGERSIGERSPDKLYTYWKCESCGWGDTQS